MEFPIGDPVLDTLPRLTPPAFFELEEPVPPRVRGFWNTAEGRAELSWSPETDAGSAGHCEVRAVAGPEYEAEDEVLLATFPFPAAGVWSGDPPPRGPGCAVTFRVYTVSAAGRERGGNPVTITRPVPPPPEPRG